MPTQSNSDPYRLVTALTLVMLAGAGIYFGQPYWNSVFNGETKAETDNHQSESTESEIIRLSKQARSNLGLTHNKVSISSYWKKLQTTGVIADRPGLTDRSVTSPLDCVITNVHAMEGDIVRPGDKLFTLRVVSEYLQQAQSDYFKATKEIEILKRKIDRVQNLANSGAIPEKRILELKDDIARQRAELDAHGQELLARGFDRQQRAAIAAGNFISTIEVTVPDANPRATNARSKVERISFEESEQNRNTFLEVQSLKADLGQQVHSGDLLAVLANHNYLYIKGHAFKKEAGDIARATENNWNVQVEFLEDTASDWEPFDRPLNIRHLSNTIDPVNRTFDYFIPLDNQSRTYNKNGETFVVWRFRPGQRVRIHVPIREIQNVVVVPTSAVINDGPNAYVFQQNGELYKRISVNVIHQDRISTVIANDNTLLPGFSIASNSAASLNRILKAQNASGENAGNYHVHADGTVHANH